MAVSPNKERVAHLQRSKTDDVHVGGSGNELSLGGGTNAVSMLRTFRWGSQIFRGLLA